MGDELGIAELAQGSQQEVQPRSQAPQSEEGGSSGNLLISLNGHPREQLAQLADQTRLEVKEEKENLNKKMQIREQRYLDDFPSEKREELRQRYEEEGAHKEAVGRELHQFASDRGINLDEVPQELAAVAFESDNNLTEKALERLVNQFFNNERASLNPEKLNLVLAQTKEYLQLLKQAQAEGSIPKDLKAADVYHLVADNIAVLAWQDRVASENLLGDHGVRHLVGHNIRVAMEIATLLEAKGVKITARKRYLDKKALIFLIIIY